MAEVDSLLRHLLPGFVAEWRGEGRENPATSGRLMVSHCSYYR